MQLGNINVTTLKVGSGQVDRVFRGSQLSWENFISGLVFMSLDGAEGSTETVTGSGNAYTFTVPLGIDRITVRGAGGGGSGAQTDLDYVDAQGGEAAKEINRYHIAVTAGDTLSVSLGTGGTGAADSTGNSGSSTVVSGTTIDTLTGAGGCGGHQCTLGVFAGDGSQAVAPVYGSEVNYLSGTKFLWGTANIFGGQASPYGGGGNGGAVKGGHGAGGGGQNNAGESGPGGDGACVISWFSGPPEEPTSPTVYNSNNTFYVPTDVTSVNICMVGGGGSGAFFGNIPAGVTSLGGGHAGVIVSKAVAVTPNTYIEITIGAGGIGVATSSEKHGNAGTATSFGAEIAAGGAGGLYNIGSAISTYAGEGGAKVSPCDAATYYDGTKVLNSDDVAYGGEAGPFGDGEDSVFQGPGTGVADNTGAGAASVFNGSYLIAGSNGGSGKCVITWG